MRAQVLSTQMKGSSVAYISGTHRYIAYKVDLILSKNHLLQQWVKFLFILLRQFKKYLN